MGSFLLGFHPIAAAAAASSAERNDDGRRRRFEAGAVGRATLVGIPSRLATSTLSLERRVEP